MRHSFIAVIVLVVVAGSFADGEKPVRATRAAVIRLEYVVYSSKAGKKLRATLEQAQKKVRADLDAKAKAANAIRKQLAGATGEARATLTKKYEDLQIDIRRARDDAQRRLSKIQSQGIREIEKLLEPVVQKYVEEKGIDLILNNQAGVVIYATKAIDISDAIISRLNGEG